MNLIAGIFIVGLVIAAIVVYVKDSHDDKIKHGRTSYDFDLIEGEDEWI